MQKNNKQNKPVTKQQVKSMLRSQMSNEEKRICLSSLGTVTGGFTNIDSTGTLTSLTSFAQGVTTQTRTGNNATAVRIWGSHTVYASSSDIYNTVRFIILEWTDNAQPVMSDILQSSTNYLVSFYNIDNYKSGKLKILYDKIQGTNEDGSPPAIFKYDMKVHIPMQWISASAVPAVSRGVWLLTVSDSTVTTHATTAGAMMVEFRQ